MPITQTAAQPVTNQSQPENPQSAAPKIELPKGGGAIRGIGEKFETNTATGTGKISIPLGITAGRSGFTPQLSLGYDSGSGNGPFGVGWSLPLHSITRKTDKGLPCYRRAEIAQCDVFILSGSEDLVPALLECEPDRWINDEFEAEGHRVKRYRPRIEGLFARIERWIRLADGDEHWRSISKDNTLTVYGREPDSRILNPEDPREVFSWLISESYDDKGNAIRYEYVAEDDRGVDLCRASERNRVRGANRYIKRIQYGNRCPLVVDPESAVLRQSHIETIDHDNAEWMFEVVFDYGDEPYSTEECDGRAWASYTPAEGRMSSWPVRLDPFSKYRSRFEVRTYRLCHRVLMLHHFPQELGHRNYLVRSTEFVYHQKTIGSFITSFTQSGYVHRRDVRYLRRDLPPFEIEYTESPLANGKYREYKVCEIDQSSLQNLPSGIDEKSYRWIDLNGEGISGILSEQGSSWFYKPNQGNGRFGPTATVMHKPSIAEINRAGQQLVDISGDGTKNLVQFSATAPGFYTRSNDGEWRTFQAFQKLPVLDWNDPNLRFVDVTGDGIADILITEDDAILWHQSLLEEGFGPAIRVAVSPDERKSPHVIFADGVQSIYLADMSGDGLSDLVRVRNGEVCYFPNRGYGLFGPKIVMEDAPWFAEKDLFEQSRVRLIDTDGSGCTDIVYLGAEGIDIYLNESGNRWSSPRRLKQFAPIGGRSDVSVVDLLGRGTACLLWSSALPADHGKPLCYIDLMNGQKPHLLVRMNDNLGAETRIEYASSTEFYLADKAAGNPWVTRLPFPVHVVKRVETFDFLSRNRFVTSYKYHHGFFDSYEREFRGFGMVEHVDREDIETLSQPSPFPFATNEDRASSVPPILTKTWYHTGVFLGMNRVSRHLAHEYYREPVSADARGHNASSAMLLDDSVLPRFLNGEDAREACRSLKGTMLRQEIYALDDTDAALRPYSVAETNMTIRVLQPRQRNLHCVFFTHERENISCHYERKLYEVDGSLSADPRVSHKVTLRVDDFGNVLASAAIAYGRRFDDCSPLLTDTDRVQQKQLFVTLAEGRFTNPITLLHAYRAPMPAETRNYQLIHAEPCSSVPGITNLFRFHELQRLVDQASDGFHDLPYEDLYANGAVEPGPYRRLYGETRSYYRADNFDGILPLGRLETLALPGRNYKLVFTPGLIETAFRRGDSGEHLMPHPEHALGEEGGYVQLDQDGYWWEPTGQIFYSPFACSARAELLQASRHFFLPRRYVDPFDFATIVSFDAHDLMPIDILDPIGNNLIAEIDYRVLSLTRITDSNRNRTELAFDALGMVAGMVVMGKQGQCAGDSLDDFEPDLEDAVVRKHMEYPFDNPHQILGLATTRYVYDLFAYFRTRHDEQPQPPAVYTLLRETHAAELCPGEQTRLQHSFSYSDGFSREIQHKLQAEPGPLEEGGPEVNGRWLGTGWTIYNNKGKPVRQYEPFFSATHTFESARTVGISSILFYDPAERVVATLHPNKSYEKVVFDPWMQAKWDVNDTVLVTDSALDPDVGKFFSRLPATSYMPSWYTQRIDGDLGSEEREAARQTALHANTPTYGFVDSMGRTILAVAHNRFERDGRPAEEFIATRNVFDIAGNELVLIDGLGRPNLRNVYNLRNTRVRQSSIDAGTHWTLADVVGKQMITWDSRGYRLHQQFDALHRPTGLHVRRPSGSSFLAEKLIYGEGQSNDIALNLRGKVYRQFDGAGVVTNEQYDFKGNLLRITRRLLTEYRNEPDWSADNELEAASYINLKTFDALNRATTITTPDRSVAIPRYNESNLLTSLRVHIRGAEEATEFISFVNYDAKGQRSVIDYGNGTRTRYDYDPLTFRLVHLVTDRASDQEQLQDLDYTFDPIGNITFIRDSAQHRVCFRNQIVDASNAYVYDSVYRLISATGREHAGMDGQPQTTSDDAPRMNYPLHSDGHALHRYRESYEYDGVGNILKLLHCAQDGNWSRYYYYGRTHSYPESNRLALTSCGQLTEHYGHDADGNMTRMPHLPVMEWDFKDQLRATRRETAAEDRGDRTYYTYNGAGERVRKVTERASGSRVHERIYFGGFEIYRNYDSVGRVRLERETLNVADDKRLIALVETKTRSHEHLVETPVSRVRHQLDNHLGSCVLEADSQGAVISYEEYYPYGSTSYEAVEQSAEVSRKRYRYTSKERDEETGLYYHSARYYAPWLGRWVSSDPAGTKSGESLYVYSGNSPSMLHDPSGADPEPTAHEQIRTAASTSGFTAAAAKLLTGGMSFTSIGQGLRSVGIKLNIDEITAVANGGSWSSASNKQFLDSLTNQFTKNAGIATHQIPPRPQISLADELAKGTQEFRKAASELMTRSFSEVKELESLNDAAVSGIRNLNRTPRKLANAVNASVRGRIARAANKALTAADTGLKRDAKLVAAALKEAGFDAKTLTALRQDSAVATVVADATKGASVAVKIARAAAPVIKALKPLAPAVKVIGKVAGPLGVGLSLIDLATAKNTDERVDAGIGLVGNALLASDHPVAMAGGAGILAGQYIEKKLNVSEVSSGWGVATYEKLKEMGVGDTTSFVAGGVVTVLSTPTAIGYAATDKLMKLF